MQSFAIKLSVTKFVTFMISYNPSTGHKLTAMSFKKITKYFVMSQMGELGKTFRAKTTPMN